MLNLILTIETSFTFQNQLIQIKLKNKLNNFKKTNFYQELEIKKEEKKTVKYILCNTIYENWYLSVYLIFNL